MDRDMDRSDSFRQRVLLERLTPLDAAARPNLVFLDAPDLSFAPDESEEAALRRMVGVLGDAVGSFFQLYSVYENTIVSFKMSRRYPWRDDEIAKTGHLGMVWFAFVNQCGLFRDKAKSFFNAYNRAMQASERDRDVVDVASKLRLIDEALGEQVRARGGSFHDWYVEHSGAMHLELPDLVDSAGKLDSALGKLEGYYGPAQSALSADIESAVVVMEDILIAALDREIPALIAAIGAFNAHVDMLKDLQTLKDGRTLKHEGPAR
jgi:hypothetical protein